MSRDVDAPDKVGGSMDSTPEAMRGREAIARFLGVGLLMAVAYLHLLDISHKIEEGIWYMVVLFGFLILGATVLAAGLVRSQPRSVRLVWAGAALLGIGALAGYVVSRVVALPGMADHRGDWTGSYGMLAVFAEVAVLALAAYAMRDLTVRGVRHEPSIRLLGLGSSVHLTLLMLMIAPQAAIAHGGVDDESEASAGATGSPGDGSASGVDAAASPALSAGTPTSAGGHGDALLGAGELGLAALGCIAFRACAGRSLAAQAAAT
ncbi:MAG: hypothetical protein ACR2LK_07645 [Solirubrobacteraceae bacterium]